MMMALLLLLGACRDVPDTSEAEAGDGSLFDFMQPCRGELEGEGLDLWVPWADGIGPESTYEELVAALGEPEEIEETTLGNLNVSWARGIYGYFSDDDGDGWPSPDEEAGTLYLVEPFDGVSDEGLGLGAESSCFLEALGDPDEVDLEKVD